jgi:hypothetical protein
MSADGLENSAVREGGKPVGKQSPEKRRDDREKAARVAEALAGLATMSTADLAAKFEALTGREPRSRNKQWLRKRVAWHLQAAEYGGLSDAALAKIDELIPLALKLYGPGARRRTKGAAAPKQAEAEGNRDPRLPAPGTALQRTYDGKTHEVLVLEKGFEFRGERYRSLSKVAREITGTPWNGLVWFGLGPKGSKREDAA